MTYELDLRLAARRVENTNDFKTVHYFCSLSGDLLGQNGPCFEFHTRGEVHSFEVPAKTVLRILSKNRMLERLLRTDKGVAVISSDYVVVFYQSGIYRYSLTSAKLDLVKNISFRNPLYGGVLVSSNNEIFFGEYFGNWNEKEVSIFRSKDSGATWQVAYRYKAGEIFHIHGIYEDPYTGLLWVLTGDFDGQCKIDVFDKDLQRQFSVGDGTQTYRAVSILFYEDYVVWGMDSPLVQSSIIRWDRATKKANVILDVEGPVWFSKKFEDGSAVLQTTVEGKGADGVLSRNSFLYFSKDGLSWKSVESWQKDAWPNKYFRHGLVCFAGGKQYPSDFYLQGEALKGIDGIAGRYGITGDTL